MTVPDWEERKSQDGRDASSNLPELWDLKLKARARRAMDPRKVLSMKTPAILEMRSLPTRGANEIPHAHSGSSHRSERLCRGKLFCQRSEQEKSDEVYDLPLPRFMNPRRFGAQLRNEPEGMIRPGYVNQRATVACVLDLIFVGREPCSAAWDPIIQCNASTVRQT